MAEDSEPQPRPQGTAVPVAPTAEAAGGERALRRSDGDDQSRASRPPRAVRTPSSGTASPAQKRRVSSQSGKGDGGGRERGARASAGSRSHSNTPTLPPLPPPVAGAVAEPPVAARTPAVVADDAARMLSDSQPEREIAEFGRVLDDMLARVTCRELVKKTADYMAAFPQHSVRFQLKMKQRAFSDATRQFQAKLMLFYVLHEFLKSFQGEQLAAIQREWFQTVDDVLHACVRDLRNNDDGRKRLFKTLARWEELKLYPQKIKGWKSLVMGDTKPRRAFVRLPKSEAERQMEAPDQLQQFPPPLGLPQIQIDRTNYPFVFERRNFASKYDLKQHWRFTAVAFIEVLAQCLGLSREISLTAAVFFHRVFDRGIYAQERFKFAAACIFLAAKAASKRMKLIRMVRTMHDILEKPLLAGDEEILELERMQLLHYEIEVLKAIKFDLTIEMPFYYLRRTLEQMPEDFRNDISQDAQEVLEELFWIPECLTTSPHFLAEAAAYISSRNHDHAFDFRWCHEDEQGKTFRERDAKGILKHYRLLAEWKKGQRSHFETLARSAGERDLREVFKEQQGGLRVDTTLIQIDAEYTEKGKNESKDRVIVRLLGGEDATTVRSSGSDRSRKNDTSSRPSTSQKRRRDPSDEYRPIKQEYDSHRSDRDSERAYSTGRERDRGRSRDRDERDRNVTSSRNRGEKDSSSRSYSKYHTSTSRRSEDMRSSRDSSRDRSYQSDQRWEGKNSRRGRDDDQEYDRASRDRDYDRYDSRERNRYDDRGGEYSSRRYDDRDRYYNYDDRRGAREYDERYDRDRGRSGDRGYDYDRRSRSRSSSSSNTMTSRKTKKEKKRKRRHSRSSSSRSSSRSPSRGTRSGTATPRDDRRRASGTASAPIASEPSTSRSGEGRHNGSRESKRQGRRSSKNTSEDSAAAAVASVRIKEERRSK